jgi:lipoprotein-anchoring transpeptidase ErfK/SrfK
MRRSVLAAAVVAAAVHAVPAAAERLVFSPEAFKVYGGMAERNPPQSFALLFGKRSKQAFRHRTIAFKTAHPPGTVIVRTGERRLYYVQGSGQAIEYAVGVGREGFTWSGIDRVSRKAEWPDWRPPPEMIEREAERGNFIPEHMSGGPDNPLGARAIYIGHTQFRIHGTSQPWTIGQAVSSGCIRMMNEEVIDLYDRVKLGALVVVE